MNRQPEPAPVALVGCGAVSQIYYRFALETLESEGFVHLVGVYDPDPTAAEAFCASFPTARQHASFDDLLAQAPTLVILASPPRHHPEQAVAALQAGIDVHCEKPLAPTLGEAAEMADAAVATGRRLSVGMVRRHFPATRTIARFIHAGTLGQIQSVDCFEGGPFTWPVRSADYFRPRTGSAGVLQDLGAHCLDLLTWWLGEPSSMSYEDDAMGGVEANSRIVLEYGATQVRIRLSRDWAQPNQYLITGTEGWINWQVNESNHFDHGLRGARYAGNVVLHDAPQDPTSRAVTLIADDFDACFTNQIRVLVDPAGDPAEAILAADTLTALDLVDRCYASRKQMSMPWLLPPPGAMT